MVGENIGAFYQDPVSPAVVIKRVSIATKGPAAYWLIPGCYYPSKTISNVCNMLIYYYDQVVKDIYIL